MFLFCQKRSPVHLAGQQPPLGTANTLLIFPSTADKWLKTAGICLEICYKQRPRDQRVSVCVKELWLTAAKPFKKVLIRNQCSHETPVSQAFETHSRAGVTCCLHSAMAIRFQISCGMVLLATSGLA